MRPKCTSSPCLVKNLEWIHRNPHPVWILVVHWYTLGLFCSRCSKGLWNINDINKCLLNARLKPGQRGRRAIYKKAFTDWCFTEELYLRKHFLFEKRMCHMFKHEICACYCTWYWIHVFPQGLVVSDSILLGLTLLSCLIQRGIQQMTFRP